MSKGKPLVVLAGWLGCQKRSLRRYENLFQSHGYEVLSRIASPVMVVESCFQKVPPPPLKIPNGWPINGVSVKGAPPSMQDFAWNILQEVNNRNCDYLIFYAFSNGGCFVWESVRRILNLSSPGATMKLLLNEDQYNTVKNLREKTVGVVFDSCPSQQLADVGRALMFCTLSERMEVMMSHGMDIAFFPSLLSQAKRIKSEIRGQAYYEGLWDDPSAIPQLYLYSESDILIPSQPLDELVQHRRKILGSDRVFCRKWSSSRHCAHLIDNAEDYVTTAESFLEICRPKSPSGSKL